MPLVTLVGYRGSGKSTVAELLAARLGASVTDADAELESRLGLSLAEFIGGRGEPAFRDAEAALLAELLPVRAGVFSTGGGVVLRKANRDLLRQRGRPVVWIACPAETIRRRLAADPATATRRPALAGGDPLAEVAPALTARDPLYREVADAVVDSGPRTAAEVAEWIAAWLAAGAPAGGLEDRAC